MKKIISNYSLAAFALGSGLFAVSANALIVDTPVSWLQRDLAGVATGVSGTTTAGVLGLEIANPLLASNENKPSYRVDFSVAPAAVIAGQIFDHLEWSFQTNNMAGGSATSSNPGGSAIFSLSSLTQSQVGTTANGNDILDFSATAALAGGSFTGGFQSANPTLSLTDTTVTANTGGYFTNNALSLFAVATAQDVFSSDGNSEAAFVNYSQFGVAARYVYRDAPPPPVQTPEPATLALMGLGFAGFAASRRKKQA